MKANQWKLSLALCLLVAAPLLQSNEETKITPEEALNRLGHKIKKVCAAIEKAAQENDRDALWHVRGQVEQLALEVTDEAKKDAVYRKEGISGLLRLLQVVEVALPADFDPMDPRGWPASNVAPPIGKSGIVYDAGIAPDAIQDADDRKAYEAALAENNRKALQYASRLELLKIKNALRSHIANYHNMIFGDDLAERATAAPEELLAGLAASLQTGNTDAANATFNELAVLCGERIQDGPEKMTRREKLKYRLRIIDIIGLNIDERPEEKFDINPAATVSSGPLEEKVDPAFQAERERYVAEHQRRANQSRLQASLKRSKRLWTEKLKVFIGRYYDDSLASIVEIKEVLGETITDKKAKNEIGQVLGLLDSP